MLTADDFKPLVGELIKFVSTKGNGALTLKSVSADPEKNKGDQVRFSLMFTGSEEVKLPQGCYTLNHAKLDDPVVFISPCGVEDKVSYYEAVFAYTRKDA